MLALAGQPDLLERGIAFHQGPSFYRPQSCFSRDLAVLSALIHRQEADGGRLRVLDLMAGSGIRGMRYLQHANADAVWCNDLSLRTQPALLANLGAAVEAAAGGNAVAARQAKEIDLPLLGPAWLWAAGPGRPSCTLSHQEASRLLAWCVLASEEFDLIDADSFGCSQQRFLGLAMEALATGTAHGALLCLTSTAGLVAGGNAPAAALSAYGAALAPVPHANEQGLRVLLGLACREALARHLLLEPLWSLYSSHGPVFRCMLRLRPAASARQVEEQQRHYGFLRHDTATGENEVLTWQQLGSCACGGGAERGSGGEGAEAGPAGAAAAPAAPAGGAWRRHRLRKDSNGPAKRYLVSGPLWTGPLQDGDHLQQAQALAESRGWMDHVDLGPVPRSGGGARALGGLLALLAGEADTALMPWHVRCDDVGRWGRLEGPPGSIALVGALRSRGYAAALTHIHPGAVRTDASMRAVLDTCRDALGIRQRQD